MTTQASPQNGGQQNGNTMLAPVGDAGGLRRLVGNDRIKSAIAEVASRYVTPDKLFKLTILAATQNPTLFQCTQESLIQSIMVASQMGLEISPTQGHLVPYNKKIKTRRPSGGYDEKWVMAAQFIPDYRGLVLLAKRAGAITKAEARVVYRDDEFVVDYGEDKIVHKADITSQNRGLDDVIAVYFRVKFPDGDYQFEVMTFDEVEAIRERSKAKDAGPWQSDWAEMAKKTVTKRGLKYIAVDSPELAAAIEHDNRFETGEVTSVNEILDSVDSVASRMAETTANKQDDLRERLKAEAAARENGGDQQGERRVPDWEKRTLEEAANDTSSPPTATQPLFTSPPVDETDPKRKLIINGVRTPFFVLAQNGRDKAKRETLELMADVCSTIGVKLADELDSLCKARPEELSQDAAKMILSFLQGKAENVIAEKKKSDQVSQEEEFEGAAV